jgi:hypothetical protein
MAVIRTPREQSLDRSLYGCWGDGFGAPPGEVFEVRDFGEEVSRGLAIGALGVGGAVVAGLGLLFGKTRWMVAGGLAAGGALWWIRRTARPA